MEKTDFKKTLKHLYQPSAKNYVVVEVPAMRFVMVDGSGNPNTAPAYIEAVQWLYGVSYALKFASKKECARDYVVPPLEALWWADDMTAFAAGDKDKWSWTAMIMQPDWITDAMFSKAVEKANGKLGKAPESLRFETFDEGLSVQIMHIGSYDAEAPTIARLHQQLLPENGLAEAGHHHEIYLSDPRRVPAEKLKTILRQPVRRL